MEKNYRPKMVLRTRDQILRFIQDNNLRSGDKLPSERELAEKMNVSRQLIRSAIAYLIREHKVVTRSRSGTYVADRIFQIDLSGPSNKQRLQIQNYTRLGTRILFQERVETTPAVAAILDIDPETPVMMIKNLIGHGNGPLVISFTFFPLDLFPEFEEVDYSQIDIPNVLISEDNPSETMLYLTSVPETVKQYFPESYQHTLAFVRRIYLPGGRIGKYYIAYTNPENTQYITRFFPPSSSVQGRPEVLPLMPLEEQPSNLMRYLYLPRLTESALGTELPDAARQAYLYDNLRQVLCSDYQRPADLMAQKLALPDPSWPIHYQKMKCQLNGQTVALRHIYTPMNYRNLETDLYFHRGTEIRLFAGCQIRQRIGLNRLDPIQARTLGLSQDTPAITIETDYCQRGDIVRYERLYLAPKLFFLSPKILN